MDLIPVQSTNLAAVGYDPTTQTLRVQFVSGKTGDYQGVPPDTFAALMAAQSKGRAFVELVRPYHEFKWVGSK